MPYTHKLGNVRGKTITYEPSVDVSGSQPYINWTITEGDNASASISTIMPLYVYKPRRVGDNLVFDLTLVSSLENQSSTINMDSIKGDTGSSVIETRVVSSLPSPSNADKHVLYIIDTGEAYASAAIYNTAYDNDNTKEPFIYLESFARFSDYYTKTDIDESFYTKATIDSMLSSIAVQQANIQSLLGSVPNLDIQNP